eukprot:1772963-Rhodomonas_salina.2
MASGEGWGFCDKKQRPRLPAASFDYDTGQTRYVLRPCVVLTSRMELPFVYDPGQASAMCYAVSGTENRVCCYEVPGTKLLVARNAMSGTDVAYGATRLLCDLRY